jgi:hypothetical protein
MSTDALIKMKNIKFDKKNLWIENELAQTILLYVYLHCNQPSFKTQFHSSTHAINILFVVR